jgi:subtilase family serine protease
VLSGAAEVALENMEEQQAAAQGVTFFIAQGDNGADQCSYGEYSGHGISSGDNTASAYAVDVGGTDFMAQYNQDLLGISVSRYWSAKNDAKTLQSAISYIPEIPWNGSCASKLIYSDPVNRAYASAAGPDGFCNSSYAKKNYFVNNASGSGEGSSCFTGKASIPGVVSGSCKGNPKPSWQTGVPGIPNDGVRDQPDIAFFAAYGTWGSLYVACLSDTAEGGTKCTPYNDAILLGGGGTSFASPAMAGIQALIDQKHGRQGNTNYVLYALAAKQFKEQTGDACNASSIDGTLPAGSCIFNDITKGDNAVPCGKNHKGKFYDCPAGTDSDLGVLTPAATPTKPAYKATRGYDFPTGLGSINATALFDAWP